MSIKLVGCFWTLSFLRMRCVFASVFFPSSFFLHFFSVSSLHLLLLGFVNTRDIRLACCARTILHCRIYESPILQQRYKRFFFSVVCSNDISAKVNNTQEKKLHVLFGILAYLVSVQVPWICYSHTSTMLAHCVWVRLELIIVDNCADTKTIFMGGNVCALRARL